MRKFYWIITTLLILGLGSATSAEVVTIDLPLWNADGSAQQNIGNSSYTYNGPLTIDALKQSLINDPKKRWGTTISRFKTYKPCGHGIRSYYDVTDSNLASTINAHQELLVIP